MLNLKKKKKKLANKGAKIFLQCLSAGFVPEGMSDAQMKELEDTFGL